MSHYTLGIMIVFGLSWESNIAWKYNSPGNDAAWTGWIFKDGVWNHSLMQTTYISGNTAGGPWKDLSGKINGPPAVANSKGVLHLFHTGTDHAIYHKTWDGVSYSPGELTYTRLEAKELFRPGLTAVSIGEEEVSIFAIGLTDSCLYHFHWTLANGWGAAEKLPGLWSGCLSAVSDKPGCWDLFGLNMKSRINHISFRNGNISALEEMRGPFLSVEAISCGPDTLELVTMGVNSAVYHNSFSKGGWTGWFNLRLPVSLAQKPVPVSHSPGALSVICNGKDSVLYIRSRDPTWHSWGNWTNIQGTIVSGISVV